MKKFIRRIIWLVKSKYHKKCEYGKCDYCTKDFENWKKAGRPKKWKGGF